MAKQWHPKNPRPEGYIPTGGRKHKVSTGESLATIAKANGISEDDLNQFTFGTKIPEEINWYLQHRVGCKKETSDHLNWMFTNDASPGIIYLPPLPPGAKPPVAPARPPSIGPAQPALQPVPATLAMPDMEIKYEIDLPKTKPVGPVSSPVLVSISGKIVVKGTLKVDGSHSKISATTSGKAEVELKFKEKFGELKMKAGFKPGEATKVGLEWTPNNIPIAIEFAANADLAKPFTVSGKWKDAIKIVDFKLDEHQNFTGTITPQLDFNFSPNPAWPGWQAAARIAAQGGRAALQTGANAVRGIFIAEEAGTLTAVGVAAVAVGITAAMVGWVAFGFYQMDKAHRTGATLSIKYGFAGGYASALAELTSDTPTVSRAEVTRWLSIDWEASLRLFIDVNTNGDPSGQIVSSEDVKTLGKAAIAQDVDEYIKKNGVPAWDAIKKKHQKLYGATYMERRERYSRMLMLQIQSGRDPIGVPILQ